MPDEDTEITEYLWRGFKIIVTRDVGGVVRGKWTDARGSAGRLAPHLGEISMIEAAKRCRDCIDGFYRYEAEHAIHWLKRWGDIGQEMKC